MPEKITLERALHDYGSTCRHALVEAGWEFDHDALVWIHPMLVIGLSIEHLGWAVLTALTKIWCEHSLGSEVAFPIRDIAPDPLRWALTELELELKK